MFDTVCKFLIEMFSTDFASWLLGEPVELTELSPSELSLEPVRADALMLLQSTKTILHVEFQSRPDFNIAYRMIDYRLRVYRRFPKKAMRQVVIYLKPTQSATVYQTTFEIPRTRHEFEVIRLWEQPPDTFLTNPGLLPFAVLAQTENRTEMLQQVATQIETIPDSRTQANVAASTAVLAGLLLDKALVKQILRKEIMQDSVIYQEIKAEGLREGRQEGRAEGRQEGLQEGIEKERALVLRQLTRKVGKLADETSSQVRQLFLTQLESLGEALLDFETVADLTSWLESHRDDPSNK